MLEFSKCTEPGCNRPIHANGLCNTCYRRKLRQNDKQKDRELIAAYVQQHLKQNNSDEMGIERGHLHTHLAKLAIGALFENNTLDIQIWIEKNITLPVGHGYKGQRKMNFEMFPHAVDILTLIDNPECKRIVLCFAAQSGKTDLIISIAAYLAGYRNRRGIYVLPTAKMFDKVRDTRIFSLLDSSKDKVGFHKIENQNTVRFANRNFYYLALASSPGTLAEQTGTSWVILDELDEFKQEGKGHNPVDLAEKRMQTSLRRLTIIACTPKRTGTGYTYHYYNRTKRFIEEIQCPLCDAWFVPEFYHHFKWPQNVDYNTIEVNNLAWLEYPCCQGSITDGMHYFIVTKKKRWKDLDPDLTIAECGFRLPIFLTPNKNWSATVAAYLKSLDDPFSEIDFNNSWLAKPKDDENTRRSYDIDFSRLKGNWLCERNEIPEGVYRLTAGVDVGDHEIYFVLLGWGNEGRNFVIHSKKIPRGPGTQGFEDAMSVVMEMCNPANYRIKGTVPKFSGGLIDSGDDNETVYDFCREFTEWKPSKGYTKMDSLTKIGKADPDNKHRGKYKGLTLYLVNTNSMQNIIRRCFQNMPGTPQSIQFAEDAPEMLFEHMRNQQQYEITKRGERSEWRWGKIGTKPDHLLDAFMQAKFAGSIMGLHRRQFETPSPKPPASRKKMIKVGNVYGK
ncbi:MAG: phage terminase large subunit family protein [Fibromonadaceae bacterium]|jgi:phage terminase large subunit GpA-like protein|nr:phage terminase large subunit family protein [Fibromonadaceae bacterium]